MTAAAIAFDPPVVDRRWVLRAGIAGGAALALSAVEPTWASIGSSSGGSTGVGPAALPSASAWASLVGDEVVMAGRALATTTARVIDVSDVSYPSPAVTGEAFSVLFDAAGLPAWSAAEVTIYHRRLDAPSIVVLPVYGDGSWEATFDYRTPTNA
jgi:hypothetical protein